VTTEEFIDTADTIAKPKARVMLPVSFVQWDRLKDRVKRLGNPRLDFTNYVMGAWGICIPCALSFFVYLFQPKGRPAWALAVYGITAAASGAAALVLRKFQSDERQIRNEDADDIVAEMDSIEEAWQRGETG